MSRSIAPQRQTVLILVLACMASLPRLSTAAENWTHRGFTINNSQVQEMEKKDELHAAMKQQIDIVCEVGLPSEVLTFLRNVPIEVVPAGTLKSPGLYRGNRRVAVGAGMISVRHQPILLHELMHAFHDQMLQGGYKNPDIPRYYARAKQIGAYAENSHMMLNDHEFFACSATAYLYGVTAQEPFDREKVRKSQPQFYAWLQSLFGPTSGNFAGSLPGKGQ